MNEFTPAEELSEDTPEHREAIAEGVAEYEGDSKNLIDKLTEAAAQYEANGNDEMVEYIIAIRDGIERERAAMKRQRHKEVKRRKSAKQARKVTRARKK